MLPNKDPVAVKPVVVNVQQDVETSINVNSATTIIHDKVIIQPPMVPDNNDGPDQIPDVDPPMLPDNDTEITHKPYPHDNTYSELDLGIKSSDSMDVKDQTQIVAHKTRADVSSLPVAQTKPELLLKIEPGVSGLYSLAIDRSGRIFSCPGLDKVVILNSETGKLEKTLKPQNNARPMRLWIPKTAPDLMLVDTGIYSSAGPTWGWGVYRQSDCKCLFKSDKQAVNGLWFEENSGLVYATGDSCVTVCTLEGKQVRMIGQPPMIPTTTVISGSVSTTTMAHPKPGTKTENYCGAIDGMTGSESMGLIFVANRDAPPRITVFRIADGQSVRYFGIKGMSRPFYLAFDEQSCVLYVADYGGMNCQISGFCAVDPTNGKILHTFQLPSITGCTGLAVHDGKVYFAQSNQILVYEGVSRVGQ
jgi:hypothetical protein